MKNIPQTSSKTVHADPTLISTNAVDSERLRPQQILSIHIKSDTDFRLLSFAEALQAIFFVDLDTGFEIKMNSNADFDRQYRLGIELRPKL